MSYNPDGAIVDEGNSTTTQLGAGESFVGTAVDMLQWMQVNINLLTDQASATDGVAFEWSHDGTTWYTPVPAFNHAGGHRQFQFGKYGRYFRVNYTNGSTPTTTLSIQTILASDQSLVSIHRLDSDLSADRSVEVQRAVIAGQSPDGNFNNIRVDDRQSMNVNIGSTVATFGDLIASNRTDQLAVNFANTTPDIIVDTTVTGTGTVTNAAAQSVVASGTTASSTSKMETRRTVFYSPSHEMYAYFTATFSAPTANGEQFIGLYDDDDGFAIGYAGTDFCVRRRDTGVDFDVAIADFNGNLLTEFTRDGVAETLNQQLANVYRIRFGWLGNAPIRFEVLAPDGNWVLLHSIKYPNSSTSAHISNPNLPLRSYVENGADSTNVSIATSSWAAGVVKVPSGTDVIFQKTSVRDGSLPTGGAPTIDPVFNSDANVFDSGWIRTIDFPGGNFINIVGDQSVDVYLMNASTSTGGNIVGDTAPAIQTVANVPATFAAPYFDDYYRILISNESGSSLTSYSIHNRGHADAQQALSIGLEQTLLGFFSSSLGRSVLAGKNDAGVYGNITRADSGGLRTAINEHEIQTPISPLTAFETGGVATVGTTPSQVATGLSAETKTVSIKSNPANTKEVYVGANSSVGVVSGYPLAAGDSIELEVNESVDFWMRSASGTQTVHWLAVNTHEDAPV